MSPPTICANLKRAGLLDVAERAARRSDLKLVDCIGPGCNPGHIALWGALAHERKTAVEIAALVCRPVEEIAAALRRLPPARPTPVPESGVRAVAPEGNDLSALAALIASAEDRVERLRRLVARVIEEATAVGADLRSLRAALDGASVAASNNARAVSVAHLLRSGDHERVIDGICAEHKIPPERLLMGARDPGTVAARRAAVVAMTERGWSQCRISVLLKIDRFAVLRHQRIAGVRPTRAPQGGRSTVARETA